MSRIVYSYAPDIRFRIEQGDLEITISKKLNGNFDFIAKNLKNYTVVSDEISKAALLRIVEHGFLLATGSITIAPELVEIIKNKA